jgi:hypothetical protein
MGKSNGSREKCFDRFDFFHSRVFYVPSGFPFIIDKAICNNGGSLPQLVHELLPR